MEPALLDEMLRDRTQKPDCAAGYIIDGYPRNLSQAHSLEHWAGQQDKQIIAVELSISEGTSRIRILKRLICGNCAQEFDSSEPAVAGLRCQNCGGHLVQRQDAKIIEQRLIVYKRETDPLRDYYESSRRLVIVNAELPAEDVFVQLLTAFHRL